MKKQLKATWTREMITDLSTHYGLDLNSELEEKLTEKLKPDWLKKQEIRIKKLERLLDEDNENKNDNSSINKKE